MRRTLSPGFLLGPSGDLQGVNLSSAHCGEPQSMRGSEFGTNPLRLGSSDVESNSFRED